MIPACEDCGARHYFSSRVAYPQVWCFPCATRRGLARLSDRHMHRGLNYTASCVPAWWRWTVYLGHVLLWDDRVRGRQVDALL